MELRKSLKPYDRDFGLKGIFAPSGVWPSTTISSTANRAYLMRIAPSRTMTITKIAFPVVVAAGSNDACDVGLYNSSFEKLVSSGSQAGLLNSLGVKEIALTTTVLQPGVIYYASFAWGAVGGTAAQVAGVNNNNGLYGDLFGTGAGARMMLIKDASFPLPASIAAPTGSPSPFLAVRES